MCVCEQTGENLSVLVCMCLAWCECFWVVLYVCVHVTLMSSQLYVILYNLCVCVVCMCQSLSMHGCMKY